MKHKFTSLVKLVVNYIDRTQSFLVPVTSLLDHNQCVRKLIKLIVSGSKYGSR